MDFRKIIEKLGLAGTHTGIPITEDSIREILGICGELNVSEVNLLVDTLFEINNKRNIRGTDAMKILKTVSDTNAKVRKEQSLKEEVYSDGKSTCIMYKGKKVADFCYEPYFLARIDGEFRYYFTVGTTSNIRGDNKKTIKSHLYFTKDILAASDKVKNEHLKSFSIDAIFMREVPTQALVDGMINQQDGFITREATGHIGVIEKEGEYYIVTPNEIYDVLSGAPTDKIIYAPTAPNMENKKVYTNMNYNPIQFLETARVFGENVHKLNERHNMAMMIGYLHAAMHEYVFRREEANTIYPILFLQGLPGSGKTSLMQTLQPFLGYAENEQILSFAQSSQVSAQNRMFASYNIPRFIDEYGKLSGTPTGFTTRSSMDIFIGAVSNKNKREKSTVNFSNMSEEYKCPLIVMGQYPPEEPSLVARGLYINLSSTFYSDANDVMTEQGKIANKARRIMREHEDKNYITGMMVKQRQMYTNKDISRIYGILLNYVGRKYKQSNRGKETLAIAMTGLYCYIQTMKSMGIVDIGFTFRDVLDIPKNAEKIKSAASVNDASDTDKFFDIVPEYAMATANSSVNSSKDLFGEGKSIFVGKATRSKYMRYGTKTEDSFNKSGEEVVYVNMSSLHIALTKYNPHHGINLSELNKDLERLFEYTKSESGRFVLAPKGYTYSRGGMKYAIFAKDLFYSRYFNVEELEEDIKGYIVKKKNVENA